MAIKLSRNILIKYWYCFSILNLSCKTKTQFATYQLGLICLHNKATKNQLFSLHLFQVGYQHYSLHNWKYFFNVFWKIKALSTISKLNLTFSTLNLSCKTKTQFATYQLGLICLHNKATKNQFFSLHLFQIGYQHYSLHDWKYFFNVFWKIKALSTISKLHLKNWFREGDFLTKTRCRPLREDEFFRLPGRDRPSVMLSMRARNKTDPDPGLGSPI